MCWHHTARSALTPHSPDLQRSRAPRGASGRLHSDRSACPCIPALKSKCHDTSSASVFDYPCTACRCRQCHSLKAAAQSSSMLHHKAKRRSRMFSVQVHVPTACSPQTRRSLLMPVACAQTSWRGSNGTRATTCCTPSASTPLACQRSSSPSRQVLNPRARQCSSTVV